MIRGWEVFVAECGGISMLSRGAIIATRWLHETHGQLRKSVSRVGVSTPRKAISTTRGMSVFVPALLKLKMYGRIYDSGLGPYNPRVRRDLNVVPRGNSRRALVP